jgi:uncharacterized protein
LNVPGDGQARGTRNILPIERYAIRFTVKPALHRANIGGDEQIMVENLHRQRVLNLLDLFSTGDIEGALSRCTDDIEFFSNAPVDILPHMGHRHGKAELKQMWETVHTRYSSMRYEVPIIVAEGDTVALNIRAFFRKRSNDRVVQFDMATFYTFRDSRIARIREIMDTFDLVEQVLERDVTAILTRSQPGKS